MVDTVNQTGGLRERKKVETLCRITETAIELFLKNGYEGSTLDDIAAEAGIARRTFFYYFKSKEAILLAFIDGGLAKNLKPIILALPKATTPLHTIRNGFLKLFSAPDTAQALAVYKLLESTDALKARMQAAGIEMEEGAFEALCELWPDPQLRPSLRMVAMASIGALRIAKEAWRNDEARQPLAVYLDEAFSALEKAI
jgi:AcrR family transcriptional regulator